MSYQGFEAGYPLVSHHVDLEFPNEGVGVSSVAVEDKWGNACGFQVFSRLYGDKMSGGYCPRVIGSSERIVGSSWPS